MKSLLSLFLVLSAVLTGYAQQILCERVLTAPANQPAFYASGLLQVQRDSLRLLGDYHSNTANATPSTGWLRPWQVNSCDTLPGRSFFVRKQYYVQNSLGRTNRRGQILVANALAGRATNSDSVMVQLRLLGRDGRVRWTKLLPPQLQQARAETAGGLLEAPDGGFYVSGVNFLARLDSAGQLLWRRNYRCGTLFSPTYTRRGTLLFALQHYTDLLVMELNQQGDSLTARLLAPTPQQTSHPNPWVLSAQMIQPLRDGGFAVVGAVDSASTGLYRPFLVRLNQQLNVQWTYLYRSQAATFGVYLNNQFSFPYELADGSLLVLQQNISSGRSWPYWLFRFSASGILQNTYAFTSQVLPNPTCSFAQCTGYFGRVQGLQPLSDSTFVVATSLGGYAIGNQQVNPAYLAHLKVPGLRRVINSYQVPAAIPLAARPTRSPWPAPAYPNPVTATLRVPLPALVAPARLVLTDLAGRQLRTLPVGPSSAEVTFDMAGLTAGVYLLTLHAHGLPPATQRLTVSP